MTTIILFKRKGKSYRMRLSRIHQHPGDRDIFEVSSTDMLDQVAWLPVPVGSSDIPSDEWIARRALWHLIEGGARRESRSSQSIEPSLVTIDLGELGV